MAEDILWGTVVVELITSAQASLVSPRTQPEDQVLVAHQLMTLTSMALKASILLT